MAQHCGLARIAISNRERETQLAFFRFVELTALEARAKKISSA
jgi:hypothetical protein